MQVRGSRVAVIGGSIAGSAAAVALGRLGCEVSVFERSSGELRDRGSGIGIPNALRQELVAAGYLPEDYRYFPLTARRWLIADGTPGGRTLWTQPGPATSNNWGMLWRSLRADVDDDRYHDGAHVTDIDDDGDRVRLTFADGSHDDFDMVVGADGYRSHVRTMLHPDSVPQYAGYILWRGNFSETQLTERDVWDRTVATGEWLTVCFDGGHGVMYPIPDFDEADDSWRVNWAIYAPQPPELVLTEPTSIPPGRVTEQMYRHLVDLLDQHFPDEVRPLFTSPREQVSIQPIYDEALDAYTQGRVMLIGDAATVSRPHTGAGATKAMQDARALESLGQQHSVWESLLAAYDRDRTTAGQALVELGRRIGRDQVENTPPWAHMTPNDFDEWTRSTVADTRSYLYQNVPQRDPQESPR